VKVIVNAFLAESPKIFFLMLAYGGIGNREIWKLFLQSANEEYYAFFVHAKNLGGFTLSWPWNIGLVFVRFLGEKTWLSLLSL
jgi:hypothetical protein